MLDLSEWENISLSLIKRQGIDWFQIETLAYMCSEAWAMMSYPVDYVAMPGGDVTYVE